MVRRGRAHLQKQGGMLASLGGDEPVRKENVHSNTVVAPEKSTKPTAKVDDQKIQLQPKVQHRQLTNHQAKKATLPEASPHKHENKSLGNKTVQLLKSPVATPSAPLSSIKINLPTISSSASEEESVRRELFQSPLSAASSSDSSNSNSSSADNSCSSRESLALTADSRSIVSEKNKEYGFVHSNSDVGELESVSNTESESNSCVSEDENSGEEGSTGSYEEIIPEHEYEEDEDYSIEVEESEDELEFDEESEDGREKRRVRPKGKSEKKKAGKSKGAVKSVEKKRTKAKLVRLSAEEPKKKSTEKSKRTLESSDDESAKSKQQSKLDLRGAESIENDCGSDSERKAEICDDFEEKPLHEGPMEQAQKAPSKEMASYISTLQHTQIKATKSSFKRFTKTSFTKEPTKTEILSVVDQLFGMIDDINKVTVGDIVHSVAEHFRVKVKKETRKMIKARLTELIYAKAAGVEAAKPSAIDDSPKKRSKHRKQVEAKKQEIADVKSDPTNSDVIAIVDQLFRETLGDTVYFSDILNSVAKHFGLSKVKKETKRFIKDRFVELMYANKDADAMVGPKQQQIGDAATLDNIVEDIGSSQDTEEVSSEKVCSDNSTSSSAPQEERETHRASTSDPVNDDKSTFSFGEIDASFDAESDADQHDIEGIQSPSSANNLEQACAPCNHSYADNSDSVISTSNVTQTPHTKNSLCSLDASIDSSDKSLAGEFLKVNDSFMSCETTLFKNLSPDCMKSTNDSTDKLMGSLSISDSLSSMGESRRIVKGQWSLGKEIGSGSFGVVHVGMNGVDGSLMAIKVLRIPSKNKATIVQELQREIDLMRSLNHSNIVRYLGAEVDAKNNILNIFQEWVAGGSVSSLLKQLGPFSISVVRSYTTQILQGLDYLHSHHIIHRDIKGGNILISNDGRVKLADFGASKRVEAFGADPDKMMEELTVRGTPYFMAPEVFEEMYGPSADVWSVGGVVYQMVTGTPPWKSLGHKNPISLFFHLKNSEDPPELPSGISNASLKELISLCFQRDPSKRPSAKELLNGPFLRLDSATNANAIPSEILKNESLIPSFSQQVTDISSPNIHDTSLSDSLCYSLTLPVPLHVNKHIRIGVDTSDWPDWAKQSYESSGSKPTNNPFSRK